MAIYMWREGPSYITTPGIYHDETNGLISLSSNGSTWITIADKNLGATTVWNSGDTLSEANCGKYYQRGNNYGFPWTGSVSTTSSRVNASTYGPGNYYSSSTFITTTYESGYNGWDSSNNANLWGNTTDTLLARRGPCLEGWHIFTKEEVATIKTVTTSLGISSSNKYLYLKVPKSGSRNFTDGNSSGQGSVGYYWTSSYQSNNPYAANANSFNTMDYRSSQGFSIRPLKNEAVQPTEERTVLYQ